MKRLIIGISGASGVIYGIRMLEVLKELGNVETHLIMSKFGRLNIDIETDHSIDYVEGLADVVHGYGNQPATIDDLINHSVGRVLDLFGIDTGAVKRWEGPLKSTTADPIPVIVSDMKECK